MWRWNACCKSVVQEPSETQCIAYWSPFRARGTCALEKLESENGENGALVTLGHASTAGRSENGAVLLQLPVREAPTAVHTDGLSATPPTTR